MNQQFSLHSVWFMNTLIYSKQIERMGFNEIELTLFCGWVVQDLNICSTLSQFTWVWLHLPFNCPCFNPCSEIQHLIKVFGKKPESFSEEQAIKGMLAPSSCWLRYWAAECSWVLVCLTSNLAFFLVVYLHMIELIFGPTVRCVASSI